MKALTLTQPWASLVAVGAKKFETRSWRTDYRGPLAIHAAKGYPFRAQAFCHDISVWTYLRGPYGDAPFGHVKALCGHVIAMCQLTHVQRFRVGDDPGERERKFGDYTPGRYVWMLDDVRALSHPIPWRGTLGLWELPDEALAVKSGVEEGEGV